MFHWHDHFVPMINTQQALWGPCLFLSSFVTPVLMVNLAGPSRAIREALSPSVFPVILRTAPEHISNNSLKQVLVYQSCCNKLPQMWCLETTEIYSLIVLEARSLNCPAGLVPSWGPSGKSCSMLSASGDCWPSLVFHIGGSRKPVSACLWQTHGSLPLCLCVQISFSSYKDTSACIGAHPNPVWPQLHYSYRDPNDNIYRFPVDRNLEETLFNSVPYWSLHLWDCIPLNLLPNLESFLLS